MLKYALNTYLPKRFLKRATFEQSEITRHILDFKDGRRYAVRWAVGQVVNALSCIDLSNTVIACVPANNEHTNKRRFRTFSDMVCTLTGAQNAYSHIDVVGSRSKLHIDRRAVAEDNVIIDEQYFRGKQVLVFDDICTTCGTADAFISKLQSAGANVRMALFLAKTKRF